MSKEYYDLAYLCKCAVNSTIPSKSRLEKMDMEQVYNAAKRHSLTGIAAYSLESAGVQNELFRTAKAKSARKNILLDFERKKLFSFSHINKTNTDSRLVFSQCMNLFLCLPGDVIL